MSQVSSQPKLADLHYRVIKALGTGAGSTIFLIGDPHQDTRYALKVVKRQDADDDIYINQALHEFEVACKLHHPNILKIYDCRTKRSWFRVASVELLMEFVDGRTLDEIEGPERGQLVLIFIHVASALAHMHRRGVYHGDLKPGNIMLSRTGDVKVIDFGTAWIKGQAKDRVQGTPQYMAPEQVTDRAVDERTDVYNLGATMYRMFTGHYANLGGIPQSANGVLGIRAKIKAPSKLDPNIPSSLDDAVLACLEGSRERRPTDILEIRNQLTAVAQSMGINTGDLRGSDDDEPE